MIDPDVAIEIPPKPEYVALVRHVVGAAARMGGLSPDLVDNVKLAVSEAATNAVTMTRRADSEEKIEVRAEIEGDRLLVQVTDRGSHEEALRTLESGDTDPSSLDFSFERGLSLPLIQGLVDEFVIEPREGGGSIVRMTIIESEAEATA
ncbi:MAG TPA: ATP-binding protein [Actinomycetota bacterium]|nr:ATP-binding protein [Actinomycetota bacterium]